MNIIRSLQRFFIALIFVSLNSNFLALVELPPGFSQESVNDLLSLYPPNTPITVRAHPLTMIENHGMRDNPCAWASVLKALGVDTPNLDCFKPLLLGHGQGFVSPDVRDSKWADQELIDATSKIIGKNFENQELASPELIITYLSALKEDKNRLEWINQEQKHKPELKDLLLAIENMKNARIFDQSLPSEPLPEGSSDQEKQPVVFFSTTGTWYYNPYDAGQLPYTISNVKQFGRCAIKDLSTIFTKTDLVDPMLFKIIFLTTVEINGHKAQHIVVGEIKSIGAGQHQSLPQIRRQKQGASLTVDIYDILIEDGKPLSSISRECIKWFLIRLYFLLNQIIRFKELQKRYKLIINDPEAIKEKLNYQLLEVLCKS